MSSQFQTPFNVGTPPPPAHIIDLGGSCKLKFQKIDLDFLQFDGLGPGEFPMGSRNEYGDEEPIHRARLTRPFYLGTYPVTREQFDVFNPEHKSHFDHATGLPVEEVSWHDAVNFCNWLNEKYTAHLPTGFQAGLPTEAQWEYACRAGRETEYHTGDGESALLEAGWFDENSGNQTQPVGQKIANGFGLYDMHGNVDEWCLDAFDEHAYKRRVDGECDPFVRAKKEDSGRVIRGGCWYDSAGICRSAYRDRWTPVSRGRFRGFRVCLFSGPCPSETELERAEQGVAERARRDDAAARQRAREASRDFFDDSKFPSDD